MENKYFKYCIVPLCRSTTVKTPEKVFIELPENKIRRIKWLKACKRNEKDISQNSKSLHVCEDHFNLENDMENYIRFKLMGGRKKMKPDIVPHIFNCQSGRKKKAVKHPQRTASIKKAKRKIVEEAVVGISNSSIPKFATFNNAPTSQNSLEIIPHYSSFINKRKTETNDASTQTVLAQSWLKVRSDNIQCHLQSGITIIGSSPLEIATTEMVTIT